MKQAYLFPFILTYYLLVSCSHEKFEEITPGTNQVFEFQFENTDGNKQQSKFIISVPLNYIPKNEYPLLLCLHGYGSNMEAFNEIWKPATDSLGVIILSPQGNYKTKEGIGFGWNESADKMVLTCMDAAAKIVNIDKSRIYVAGFSIGGTFAYELIFNYPQIFNGAAALSARLPEYYKTNSIKFLKKKKFYITAGEFETDVKDDSNDALKLMIKNAILTQHTIYFNIEHGLPDPYQPEIKKIVEYFFNK